MFSCACGAFNYTDQELKAHRKQSNCTAIGPPKHYTCAKCNKVRPNLEKATEHVRICQTAPSIVKTAIIIMPIKAEPVESIKVEPVGNRDPPIVIEKTICNKSEYKCKKCDIEFRTREKLRKHNQELHYDHKYECAACGTCLTTAARHLKHEINCYLYHAEKEKNEELKAENKSLKETREKLIQENVKYGMALEIVEKENIALMAKNKANGMKFDKMLGIISAK